MAQPASPSPSDTPDAGAPTDLPTPEQGATASDPGGEDSPGAPITDPESANEGSGASDIADPKDLLYHALGHVHAGIKLRRDEAEAAKKRIEDLERDLIAQRQKVADAGDRSAYDMLTEQLSKLSQAYDLVSADSEDDLRGPDQPEDSDERGGGGSLDQREPGESRGEQPLAGPEGDREPERGPGGGDDGDALGRHDQPDL